MVDFAAQPVNYAANIAAGQSLAFNPLEAQLDNAKVTLAQTAAQGQQIQNAAAIQALRLQQIEMQRRVQFGQDMQSFVQSPSAEGLASLIGKYPEFASDAQNAWGTLDTAERRSTATQLGSLASLVAKGNIDGAIDLVNTRIAADQQAGRDSSVPKLMLQMLQSDDPTKIKSVIGLATIGAGGAVGFDKATDFLKGLGLSAAPEKLAPGEQLVNPMTGDKIASSAPNLTPVTVTNPDGSQTATPFNPQTGAFGAAAVGGSDAAPGSPPAGAAPAPAGSPAGVPASGGFQPALQTVLHNEGGYNPKDMNGSPTMMGINWKANAPQLKAMGLTPATFKNMTPDQAAQIYQGYWEKSGAANLPANVQTPYFDVYVRNPNLAKTAWAQSGADPAKFMATTNAYFQKLAQTPKGQQYAQAWANRDAANTAMATGTAASGGAVAAPASGGSQPQASPYVFGGSSTAVNTKGAPEGYAWNKDHTAVVPLTGGDQDPNSYSPTEIEDLAHQWIVTGQPLGGSSGGGMGSSGGASMAGLRKAVMARATQIMASAGITADQLPAIRSKYAALNTTYSQNTQILNAMQSAQDGLARDAALVTSTQVPLVTSHIIRDDAPAIVNNARIAFWEQFGSPETRKQIKSYKDAVNALAQTYGKFISAANGIGGSAAPSDAARSLATELNDEGMGPTTLKGHLSTVLAEAQNKVSGFAHQNEAIKNQLTSILAPRSAQAQRPTVVRTGIDKKTGRRVVQYSDGTLAYGN